MKKLFILLSAVFLGLHVLPALSQAEVKPQKATVTADILNVRENPSPKAKLLGKLKKGNVVYIFSIKPGGWSEIRYNKKPAYVASAYLKKVGLEKVYPAIYLGDQNVSLPKTLTNGLVVDGEKQDGWGKLPIIKKDKKKVWSAADQTPINTDGEMQFTVTADGDTFLTYFSGATGGSAVNFVGVHSDGKIFVKKDFISGIEVASKFIAANKLEVMIERINPSWNPAEDPNAERHSGVWDVTVYNISSSGKFTTEKKYVYKERGL